MLALNAAIEAARAGEQGRFFAVGAEKADLASRSVDSSVKEITGAAQTLSEMACELQSMVKRFKI